MHDSNQSPYKPDTGPTDSEDDQAAQPDDFPRSPVRPSQEEPLRNRLMPSMPQPTMPDPDQRDPTPTEEIDRTLPPDQDPTQALARLRKKTAAVVDEFARGQINRAQFDAIYQRYQEQRRIIEMLLARDPETDAWQSVVKSGHTSFLRDHFKARVESYAIYHINQQAQIIRTGHVQVPDEQVTPILRRLKAAKQRNQTLSPAHRTLSDERWMLFLPGTFSLALIIFSSQPATAQINLVRDIHQDFERANWTTLSRPSFNLREMVFPHRALFEL